MLGAIFTTEGKLTEARKAHDEALAIRNQLGEKRTAAESRLGLAALAIEEGRPSEAEATARTGAEEFRKEKAADLEAQAHIVVARSLLAQGRPKEAQTAIDAAAALPQKSQSFALRLSLGLHGARVAAALGKTAEARRSLEDVFTKATTKGWVEYQLEARLALGEIEMESANPAAGRARLGALEKDGAARGFGLIARKAAVAARER